MRTIVSSSRCCRRAAAAAQPGGERLLVQKPALGRTQIVFVYGGDLWSVPREGGARSG